MSLSVNDRFAEHVRRGPDRTAVADPGTALSYRALDQATATLAGRLFEAAVRESEPVCVFTGKGVAMVVAMLSLFRSHGIYVPLDPAEPDLRIAALIDRIRPAAILVSLALRARLYSVFASMTAAPPPCVVIGPAGEVLAIEPGQHPNLPFRHVPAVAGMVGRPAYVFFTSGSTGTPKAILGSDRSLAHFLGWARGAFSVGEADRFSQLGAISSDASLKDILIPLTSGASVWVPGVDASAGAGLADWAADVGVTIIGAVPTLFRTLLEAIEANSAAAVRLARCLRLVLLAGEPLRITWVDRWFELFDARVPLANLYGATEATVFSVFNLISARPARGSATVPCGRAMQGTEILVLNRGGHPCAIGELGEIHLRSDCLSLGYLGDDEATRRSFWVDAEGRVTYRTGDLGRLRSDGLLDFAGRVDAQLKIRGSRVEPGEVENLLVGQHGVREAVVMARPDSAGDLQLVAHVLRDNQIDPDSRALRRHLSRHLPPFLVPSHIFVHSSFPHTHNGKIDRHSLARMALPQTPPVGRFTAMEEIVAGLWGELLDRPPSGPEDDFFDLGGHSLLAMQLQSRIDSAFAVRLSLADIFEAPRLSDMAARLSRLRGGSQPEQLAAPSAASSHDLLSSGQQRLWFLNQLDPHSGTYNLHAAYRLRGPLRIDALAAALSALLQRHEILRGTISATGGAPKITFQPPRPPEIPVTDLSGLDAHLRETEALRLAASEVAGPFDLSQAPLIRLSLVKLAAEDHIATMTLHHISGDMWSCAILARDLSALYAARLSGTEDTLPVLRLRYADYARAEAAQLGGSGYAQLRDYWTAALAGIPATPSLPRDFAPPRQRRFRGDHVERRLTAELTRELNDLARSHRATRFMVLLAAFAAVLRHYNGADDVVIGTDVDGRSGTDAEQVVGFFVNQLVMRCNLSGNPSFGELLGRVRTMALEAYDHRAMPFDRLVQICNPRRDPVAPIFTVKLVGQTAPLPKLSLSGLEVTPLGVMRDTAQIDLNLRLFPASEATLLSAEYDADLFRRATIEQALDKLEMVLGSVAKNGALRVDELDRMLEARDLRDWAATARVLPQPPAASVVQHEDRR